MALLVVTYQSCEMRGQSKDIAAQSVEMRKQTAHQVARSILDK